MAYNTVTITTSPTKIVNGNCSRRNLIITNTSLSLIVYIGPDSNITTSNAIPLYQNQTLNQDRIPEGYLGPIYGVVASGTADVRYWEMVL